MESSRLREWDYSIPWWYYITISTKNFEICFGEIKNSNVILNELGKVVEEEWNKTKKIRENVDLDRYVIMPNHFHGITIIKDVETSRRGVSREKETDQRPVSTNLKRDSLGSIIGQFKSICTKRIRKLGFENFQWQQRFYDHIIRDENDLRSIRTYIQNNPVKWEMDEYYR